MPSTPNNMKMYLGRKAASALRECLKRKVLPKRIAAYGMDWHFFPCMAMCLLRRRGWKRGLCLPHEAGVYPSCVCSSGWKTGGILQTDGLRGTAHKAGHCELMELVRSLSCACPPTLPESQALGARERSCHGKTDHMTPAAPRLNRHRSCLSWWREELWIE